MRWRHRLMLAAGLLIGLWGAGYAVLRASGHFYVVTLHFSDDLGRGSGRSFVTADVDEVPPWHVDEELSHASLRRTAWRLYQPLCAAETKVRNWFAH